MRATLTAGTGQLPGCGEAQLSQLHLAARGVAGTDERWHARLGEGSCYLVPLGAGFHRHTQSKLSTQAYGGQDVIGSMDMDARRYLTAQRQGGSLPA